MSIFCSADLVSNSTRGVASQLLHNYFTFSALLDKRRQKLITELNYCSGQKTKKSTHPTEAGLVYRAKFGLKVKRFWTVLISFQRYTHNEKKSGITT